MIEDNFDGVRRKRRRRQDRLYVATASIFFIGLLLGFGGALYYSWIISPAETTAQPADLRADFREDYILMVSQAYAADGDLVKAQARLSLLQAPDMATLVLAQLESYLRRGTEAEVVRNMANLAEALGAEGEALAIFVPTPEVTATEVVAAVVEPTATATLLPTPTPNQEPTATPTPTLTPTSPPTATATPPLSYRLLSQDQVCQPSLPAPQIEVVVVDSLLQEIPGVAVQVEWEGGSDRFFTGFKPQEGPGYADFTMTAEQSYSVFLPDGSPVVGGLRVEPCDSGTGFMGWQLRFQNLTLAQPTPEATDES